MNNNQIHVRAEFNIEKSLMERVNQPVFERQNRMF